MSIVVAGPVEGTDGRVFQATGKNNEDKKVNCTLVQKGENAVLQVFHDPNSVNTCGDFRILGWSGPIVKKVKLEKEKELEFGGVFAQLVLIEKSKSQKIDQALKQGAELSQALDLIEQQNKLLKSKDQTNQNLEDRLKALEEMVGTKGKTE